MLFFIVSFWLVGGLVTTVQLMLVNSTFLGNNIEFVLSERVSIFIFHYFLLYFVAGFTIIFIVRSLSLSSYSLIIFFTFTTFGSINPFLGCLIE